MPEVGPLRTIVRGVRQLRGLANLDFSLRIPPWSLLGERSDAVSVLRHSALDLPSTSRLASVGANLQALYWPFGATLRASVATFRYGAHVRSCSGLGLRQQWRDTMWLAHRLNYDPSTYYLYRLWRSNSRLIAHTFVQPDEMSVLQVRMAGDITTLGDKELFARRCTEIGVATPRVVAVFRPREGVRWTTSGRSLPSTDLFVKPVWGQEGKGAERWSFDPTRGTWSRGHVEMSAAPLCSRLQRSRKAILVQEALANHPEIAALSGRTLSTFRVVTYIGESGEAELLGVVLKLARVGSDVDNLHAGGVACAVDPATGRLQPGMTMDPMQEPAEVHPDTGAIIAGVRLTTHVGAIAVARAAHEQLDVPWSVGWDVAATPSGPVILEGNPMWAIDLLHVPLGTGLDPDFARQMSSALRPHRPQPK